MDKESVSQLNDWVCAEYANPFNIEMMQSYCRQSLTKEEKVTAKIETLLPPVIESFGAANEEDSTAGKAPKTR